MSKTPQTNKDWLKEIKAALEAAWLVIKENEEEAEGESDLSERLFVAAPVLAMKHRNIDFKKRNDVVPAVFTSISEMLEDHPEVKTRSNRVFVHAYLDTHLYLKLLKKSKCEGILDYLESKQVIETRGINVG